MEDFAAHGRAWLLMASFCVACGGTSGKASSGNEPDGGSQECTAFTVCGGNLVGRWRLKVVCRDPDDVPSLDDPLCADSSIDSSISGELLYDFSADGTLEIVGALSSTTDFMVTNACAAALGRGDAAGYCAAYDPFPGMNPQRTCASANGVCTCHIVEDSSGEEPSRTYEVTGNELRISDDFGFGNALPYCVDGSTLRIQLASSESYFLMLRD